MGGWAGADAAADGVDQDYGSFSVSCAALDAVGVERVSGEAISSYGHGRRWGWHRGMGRILLAVRPAAVLDGLQVPVQRERVYGSYVRDAWIGAQRHASRWHVDRRDVVQIGRASCRERG